MASMTSYLTVTARLRSDATGSTLELPVVIGPAGPLEPMLRYQLTFQGRSISWHRDLCFAVRMLLEYASAHPCFFDSRLSLFQSFSIRIRSGTFGPDGLDSSGLYWTRRSNRRANVLINHLGDFSNWLSTAQHYDAAKLNPMRDATAAEQVLAAAAWAKRNGMSFLGHTESKAKARALISKAPWTPRYRETTIDSAEPPRFPHSHFWNLLFIGFATHRNVADQWQRLDLRCVLITLLLHGGCLRPSECFHLWIQDVSPDPIDPYRALVRIGHPSDSHVLAAARCSGSQKTMSRAEYLQREGLVPRNERARKIGAGWKNPKLSRDHVLHVHWRSAIYARLFLVAWVKYMQQLRTIGIDHPWAFVNLSHNAGSPYQLSDYQKAHAAAVRRIGLVPSKVLGTTPYGHRHDYIGFCADAGLDSATIQALAHHKSPDSQQAYKQPGVAKLRSDIEAAVQRLESMPSELDRNLFSAFGL